MHHFSADVFHHFTLYGKRVTNISAFFHLPSLACPCHFGPLSMIHSGQVTSVRHKVEAPPTWISTSILYPCGYYVQSCSAAVQSSNAVTFILPQMDILYTLDYIYPPSARVVELFQISNVFSTTEEYRAPLMDALGNEIENTLRSGGGKPSRLIARSSRSVAPALPLSLTCSVRNAIGNASYSIRSLPDLFFLSSG